MISLKPLITALEGKPDGFKLPWFRDVSGAAEFARNKPESVRLPVAYVVRAADKVGHAGERAEKVGLSFDIVIAIENVREHGNGETDDTLLAYRRAVKDKLLGWEIEPGVAPIKFMGGRVLEYTEGDLYWCDRYAFDALITNYLPDPVAYTGLDRTGDNL